MCQQSLLTARIEGNYGQPFAVVGAAQHAWVVVEQAREGAGRPALGTVAVRPDMQLVFELRHVAQGSKGLSPQLIMAQREGPCVNRHIRHGDLAVGAGDEAPTSDPTQQLVDPIRAYSDEVRQVDCRQAAARRAQEAEEGNSNLLGADVGGVRRGARVWTMCGVRGV